MKSPSQTPDQDPNSWFQPGEGAPSHQKPPSSEDWELADELSELLAARQGDLETALLEALHFIADIFQCTGGLLLIQSPSDPSPIQIIQYNLPENLKAQIDNPHSALRKVCQQVWETRAPIQADGITGLAATVPVCSQTSCQGILQLYGPALEVSQIRRLAWFSRPVSRAIQAKRALQRREMQAELVAPQSEAEAARDSIEVNPSLLLRSRNTLRALFDNLPASIYIIDQEYTLVALNMTRSTLANNMPSALVGRHCYEALYGQQEICSGCIVSETLSRGKNTTRTRRQWTKDIDPIEWEINTYPIRDEAGEVIQAILFEQDITEKRRLEATLAQSEKLAAVGQLAAGVAHEINNPLTAIIANAQMLQRELPTGDDRQELVELIIQASNRAAQVVRNLLDFARKEKYEFIPADINETVYRALSLINHEIISRHIRLIFEPAEELPLVLASPDHIQGVWLNLVMNALDALEGIEGEVRITTRQVGNEVRVIIADTGKGIPPERLPRIFEPFYTTKSPGRGTGLGLSVCHRIIKQHGGNILVNSQIGKGSEFIVTLPIA